MGWILFSLLDYNVRYITNSFTAIDYCSPSSNWTERRAEQTWTSCRFMMGRRMSGWMKVWGRRKDSMSRRRTNRQRWFKANIKVYMSLECGFANLAYFIIGLAEQHTQDNATHWALDHTFHFWIMYTKRKRKIYCKKKMSPHLSQLNVAMAHRNYFRWNNLWILKLATYTKIEYHYSRCKLATF